MRILATGLLLGLSAGATVLSLVVLPYYNAKHSDLALPLITLALWALFVLSLVALRGVRGRAVTVLVLAGSLAIGVSAMAGPPNTSTDSARYAWDGIVQNAGISPYAYVPTDPALEHLRPHWLFPASTADDDCTGSRIMTSHEPGTKKVVCTAINRGTVPTIYPPASELIFAAVRLVVGPEAQYWPLQLLGLVTSLGITLILLRLLSRRGLDPRWAALWGWCPLVATEGITNSHVDMLATLLVVIATALAASGRAWGSGAAIGAAIGAKLIPVIAAPALLGRRPFAVIAASVAVFALLYVPYVITDGIKVIGYLPGYLSEEGYESGSRFILFSWFAPGALSTVLVGVLVLTSALLVWRKTDPSNPWLGQLAMIGVTLLIVSPRYPWYALLLIPMIAMTGRWEWMAVPIALTERLLFPSADFARIALVLAIMVIVAVSIKRSGPGVLTRARRELRHPFTRMQPQDLVTER